MFISTYLTKYPYLENIVTFSNILDSFGKENQNSKIDLFIRKLELNGSRQDIKALIEKLEKITNKKINFEQEIDPKLIGGGILKIGDKILDGSIRTQLAQMAKGE